MKYFTKLKIFKNSTGTNTFDGKRAWSYGHYPYAYVLSDGTCLVTSNPYSSTTGGHVRELVKLRNYEKIVYISSRKEFGMTFNTDALAEAVNEKIGEAEAKISSNRVKNKDFWLRTLDALKSQLDYIEMMRLEILVSDAKVS
jgi:hypothetical protein